MFNLLFALLSFVQKIILPISVDDMFFYVFLSAMKKWIFNFYLLLATSIAVAQTVNVPDSLLHRQVNPAMLESHSGYVIAIRDKIINFMDK